MIEAVTSTIQNAALLRASAEQSSNADVFTANPAPQKIARAPSLSVYVDINYDTAVLQYRNADRDVIDQIPSETLLQTRARDEARRSQVQQEAYQPPEAPKAAEPQKQSAPVQTPTPQTETADAPAPRTSAPTQQQIAAFSSAAAAGNTNAGFTAVTVYA